MRTRFRLAGVLPCLALGLLMGLWLPGNPAMAAPALLEELHYRLEALSLQNAARGGPPPSLAQLRTPSL